MPYYHFILGNSVHLPGPPYSKEVLFLILMTVCSSNGRIKLEILYEHFILMLDVIILGYQELKSKKDKHSQIIFLSPAIMELLFS